MNNISSNKWWAKHCDHQNICNSNTLVLISFSTQEGLTCLRTFKHPSCNSVVINDHQITNTQIATKDRQEAIGNVICFSRILGSGANPLATNVKPWASSPMWGRCWSLGEGCPFSLCLENNKTIKCYDFLNKNVFVLPGPEKCDPLRCL